MSLLRASSIITLEATSNWYPAIYLLLSEYIVETADDYMYIKLSNCHYMDLNCRNIEQEILDINKLINNLLKDLNSRDCSM